MLKVPANIIRHRFVCARNDERSRIDNIIHDCSKLFYAASIIHKQSILVGS